MTTWNDDEVGGTVWSEDEAAGTALGAATGSSLVGHISSGSGAVARTVQAKEREIVSITDFAANGVSGAAVDGTGVTASHLGIQAACNASTNVYFPPPSSAYLCTGTITIAGGTNLYGPGQRGATIKFVPTAADTLFEITGSGSVVAQTSITGLRLVATGETTYVKKAIVVVDGEEIELGHISIADWSDSTHASVGFELQGRQTISCHDVTNVSDLPFNLKDSPNTTTVSCDHFHFWNIYAIAHSSQPVFKVDSDVWLTNCTWDGYQAWANGTYGIHWDASGAANRSYNVRIQNVRWEQSTNATGYALYLVPKTFSSALNVENCYTDGSHRGYYVRNFASGRLTGSMYDGLLEALNVDSSTTISVTDNFFSLDAGATLTTTGFVGVFLNNDASGANTTNGNMTVNILTARTQVLADGTAGAPAFARTTSQDMGLDFNNDGPAMSVGGTLITQWKSTGLHPVGDDTYDLGETGNRWSDVFASDSVDSRAGVLAYSATAIPAGGTTGAGFKLSSTANFGVFFGSGVPTLSAAQGSLYLRSDGSSTSTRAYINTDGGTTWTAITTAA